MVGLGPVLRSSPTRRIDAAFGELIMASGHLDKVLMPRSTRASLQRTYTVLVCSSRSRLSQYANDVVKLP